MSFSEFAKTKTPRWACLSKPMNEWWPPVSPLCQTWEAVLMCQARPICWPAKASRRGTWVFAIAAESGEAGSPMLAARNLSRSFTLERSAPQPGNAGISQLETGLPEEEWPVARRDLSSGERVMRVLSILSGAQIRLITDDS